MSELHFATIWEQIADTVPNRVAVVHGSTRRTWQEFEARAARLANEMVRAGLGPGSRIAICLANCPEYLETFFASIKIRAIPCNVNYRYRADELALLLDDFEADALVFHSSLGAEVGRALSRAVRRIDFVVEVADDERHDVPARRYEALVGDDVAPAPRVKRSGSDVYVLYTGGTTGMPKGVIRPIGPAVHRIIDRLWPIMGLTDRSFASGADLHPIWMDEAVCVSMPAAPMMHHTGFGLGATPCLVAGGRVVLLAGSRFDPDELWRTVMRERVTTLAIVGDAFARPMVDGLASLGAIDVSSVETIMSSGVTLSRELKVALLEHLPEATIVDFIASSETAAGVSVARRGAVPETGRFTPLPGVIVVSPDGLPVAADSGESGLLAVPGAFAGYRNDPERTSAMLRAIGGTIYTIPGDHARAEPDGSITLLGRGSECINTGGEKVFPEEVEEAVKRLPGVADCLVFGVPDARFGQRVVAIVSPVASGTIEPGDIVESLRHQLASYKVPRRIVVAPVPRIVSGKADYRSARSLFDDE